MGYDNTKYTAMRSAGLNHKISLALAKDDLPNIGADSSSSAKVTPLTHLDPKDGLLGAIDKINEIVDTLNQMHGA